jgi:hypothetical protein
LNPVDRLTNYQIRILGQLDERWLRWFEGLLVTYQPQGETLISGTLDQAALHGVLNRIRDLGLELISVQQIPPRTGPDFERNHA